MAFLKESVRVEVIHAFVAGLLALCVSGNILQPVSAYMPVYCRHCNQRALNANIAQIVQQRLHGHRDSPYSTQAVGHPHPHSLRVTVLLGLNPLVPLHVLSFQAAGSGYTLICPTPGRAGSSGTSLRSESKPLGNGSRW